MASAITMEGIEQAISNLEYKNQTTLKYRYVHHIRQYYTSDNSDRFPNEIDHEALIKILWDTDHSIEAIKNKRRNLNSVRSSVNADLKKLYEKEKNPEGIKIGSSNVFVMSEEAKDKMLNKVGLHLEPDGTLGLDQIMDILKLANETVSGSMVFEDTGKKDSLKKIDRLKDLIKGLSEKVGLGSPELSRMAPEDGGEEDGEGIGHDVAGKGDEDGAGSMETAEVFDEAPLDEVDEVEDVEGIDGEIAYIDDGDEDEVLDDVEDVEIDEIVETDTAEPAEAVEIDEEVEDVLDEEDTELEYVDDVEEMPGEGISEERAGESGPGDEGILEGMGPGQDSGQETTETDVREDKALPKDGGTELEDGGKEDGEGIGHDMAGKGDEDGKEQHGNEQLGLPVGSLGQEYSLETDSKIKKDKLLAEEFDGYLGSMDRYYNHYILIPGGEYIIGSKHPKKDEKPEQMVYLEPFYFGRFPVTNGLFEIFIEKTGYKTTAEKVGYGTVYYGRFEKKKDETTGLITSTWNSLLYYKTVEGACWYQPSGPKSTLYNKRNHPVVQISMEDAMAFAAWTGKRLPTENEWEAASRTANGWVFPWGTEWKKDACNIEDSYTADTTPVDKHSEFENDFGIVDSMGNVLEWTNDGFDSTSKNNHGAKYRAVKGGSWISGNDIRLFNRFLMEPESHSNVLGFRCVAY
ncbi:MAG: SUMF1/EgtB/PvdO family nonheme iron enzyme [Desulfobacterales bacterium]